MTKREVEKYIESSGRFSGYTAKRIGRGNNSAIFLLKNKEKKYTLRSGSQEEAAKERFLNHYLALKFLQEEKINFAPRPVLFDREKNILINSYIPGKPITESGLNKKYLNLFIKQLIELYSLKFNRYKKFCRDNNIKLILPETPESSLKKYGIKRFDGLKKICPDREIIEWIKPRLAENKKYINSVPWNEKNLIFSHGDLTGANIIKYKNNLYFIDWDRAGFKYNNNYSLSYMFIHFDFFYEKREEIMEKFARYKKINLAQLRQAVLMGMRGVKLNDVIWAATMYGKLHAKKTRGFIKYRQLTYRRIKQYEKL